MGNGLIWCATRLHLGSPAVYSLYINDLPHKLNSSVNMFADDVALYTSIQQEHDCISLQNDLNTISSWCKTWQMKLNPCKCKALCISNKRSPPLFQYTYDDHAIQWSDVVRYLEVIIDTHLDQLEAPVQVCSGKSN